MFSEKATKIDKIFTANLTVCSNRQIDGEDFVNFCGLLKKHELYRSLYKLKMKIENKQKFTFPSKLISTLRVMQKMWYSHKGQKISEGNFGNLQNKNKFFPDFWETHQIWKLPHCFDKSADLLSKCQNHEEDFFQIMCTSQKVRTLAPNHILLSWTILDP